MGFTSFLHLATVGFLAILLFAGCNVHDEDEDVPPPEKSEDDDPSTNSGQADDETQDDCVDEDSDGWCVPSDCQDHNPFVHPGRIEDCFDGVDNDCNGFSDADDPACPSPETGDET